MPISIFSLTSSIGLGIHHSIGHADFYPNGGHSQPHCSGIMRRTLTELTSGEFSSKLLISLQMTLGTGALLKLQARLFGQFVHLLISDTQCKCPLVSFDTCALLFHLCSFLYLVLRRAHVTIGTDFFMWHLAQAIICATWLKVLAARHLDRGCPSINRYGTNFTVLQLKKMVACDHELSLDYFAQSLTASDSYIAYACHDDQQGFVAGRCYATGYMGYQATRPENNTKYYLHMSDVHPFEGEC